MQIREIEVIKFSIPIEPFAIATGTMYHAQNTLIRIHTDAGITGSGECSAFPMITGETQSTCFVMALDFARIWKGKNALDIEERMQDLHRYADFNSTIKSAFDMALYDIAAQAAGKPLYAFLGGVPKRMETDLTIGISDADEMAATAKDFVTRGVNIIKVKLGKDPAGDVERVKKIRDAVGEKIQLRIDANQGWDFNGAVYALTEMGDYNIQFCEQPMRTWLDHKLPELINLSPVPVMADESVYDHHDAERIAAAGACDFINIKMAKSGGLLEAKKIIEVAARYRIGCMMGGMLESRLALTAFAHFAASHEEIIFYDMDTCLLGHKVDPVSGGVQFDGYTLSLPQTIGLGATANQDFIDRCESVIV